MRNHAVRSVERSVLQGVLALFSILRFHCTERFPERAVDKTNTFLGSCSAGTQLYIVFLVSVLSNKLVSNFLAEDHELLASSLQTTIVFMISVNHDFRAYTRGCANASLIPDV